MKRLKKIVYAIALLIVLPYICAFAFTDPEGSHWQFSSPQFILSGNDKFEKQLDNSLYIYETTVSGLFEIKYDIYADWTSIVLLKTNQINSAKHMVNIIHPVYFDILQSAYWTNYEYPGLQIFSENPSGKERNEELRKIHHTGTIKYILSPGEYFFSFYSPASYRGYTPDETVHFTATFTPDAKTSPETGIDNNIYTIIGVFLLSVGGAVIIKQIRRVKP